MRAACLAALLACAAPAFAKAKRTFFPEAVYNQVYAAWAEEQLKHVGEKPLWHGVEGKGIARQTRFMFVDGHPNKTRILHIRERVDGTGTMGVFSLDDHPFRVERRDVIDLSKDQIGVFTALIAQAGAFEFELGSWDGDELYMHCQLLEMERVDASGYRYSSVNIGCNQPAKLIPLIEQVMAWAKIERRDRQLF